MQARIPSTPSQMSLCQIWCLHCLWKPSPGGLSKEDLTPPRRSPREPPCLPLHSSRKRAPGPDRLHARTAGQGALRGMPASGCSRSFSTRFPGALEPISTCIIASLPLSGKASLYTEIGMASAIILWAFLIKESRPGGGRAHLSCPLPSCLPPSSLHIQMLLPLLLIAFPIGIRMIFSITLLIHHKSSCPMLILR